MADKGKNPDILKEITTTLDALARSKDLQTLSLLELDLLKEKVRMFYDRLNELPVADPVPESKPEPQRVVVFRINLVEQIDSQEFFEDIHQSESEDLEIESEQLIPATAEEEAPEPEKEHESQAPVEDSDSLDLFTTAAPEEETLTVIDKIADKTDHKSVADHLQMKSKIETLKDAIGINEKFFFINELFDGSLSDYNGVIDALDRQTSLEQTVAYLEELTQSYDWKGRQEALGQLKEFIQLKYK